MAVFISTPASAQLKSVIPIRDVESLNQTEYLTRTAQDLLVQSTSPSPQPSPAEAITVVPVTDVQLKQTDTGIEVVLITLQSNALKPKTRIQGNQLIADIPNAQLRLKNGATFRKTKSSLGDNGSDSNSGRR